MQAKKGAKQADDHRCGKGRNPWINKKAMVELNRVSATRVNFGVGAK